MLLIPLQMPPFRLYERDTSPIKIRALDGSSPRTRVQELPKFIHNGYDPSNVIECCADIDSSMLSHNVNSTVFPRLLEFES
jgi:hypothetical protein